MPNPLRLRISAGSLSMFFKLAYDLDDSVEMLIREGISSKMGQLQCSPYRISDLASVQFYPSLSIKLTLQIVNVNIQVRFAETIDEINQIL